MDQRAVFEDVINKSLIYPKGKDLWIFNQYTEGFQHTMLKNDLSIGVKEEDVEGVESPKKKVYAKAKDRADKNKDKDQQDIELLQKELLRPIAPVHMVIDKNKNN